MIEIRGAFANEEDTYTYGVVSEDNILLREFFELDDAEQYRDNSSGNSFIVPLCNGLGEIEEPCDELNPAGLDIEGLTV